MEYLDKSRRLVHVREVPGLLKDVQRAPWDRRMRVVGVGDRDDGVQRAPDDEGGSPFGEIEPVGRLNPLPAGLDDTSQRVHERAPRRAVRQRRVAPGDFAV